MIPTFCICTEMNRSVFLLSLCIFFKTTQYAMKSSPFFILLLAVAFLFSCEQKTFHQLSADHPQIRYSGRIDFVNPKEPVLIGSASYLEFIFEGDSCQIMVKKLNPGDEPNYISIELDGSDKGRIRLVEPETETITIQAESESPNHHLKVFKATEAQNNNVSFLDIRTFGLAELPALPDKKIEFIGNSITCGMGNDLTDIPCDAGVWYDQHNAYLAYGPIVARALEAQFMLSSVSGIGIYRNWNNPGPVMPDVYENMYLNTDEAKKWDFNSYTPDLVSICLGTNDMSEGDGSYDRPPFDTTEYVNAYIDFVKVVYKKYPEAQVCLLNSPMVRNENGALLTRCLRNVSEAINTQFPGRKPIRVFKFPTAIEPHGCSYHPDANDHQQMAAALMPFYKEVMGW